MSKLIAPPRYLIPPSLARQFASAVVLVLFLTRYFYVTESAGQGDTLWVVAFWLLGLLIWTAASRGTAFRNVSWGWLDLSVGLLAGGHIISALIVVATGGEKRLAINLAWEWCGVVVGWFLLRQACRQEAFRRDLLMGLMATGTAVAGLGLYQHYVDFPQLAAKYGPLFDRLRVAGPTEAATIRQKLAIDQIPVDGPGVKLFEMRLRDSREPLGFFALANTLGGFLAVCLVLAVSGIASVRQQGLRWISARMMLWISMIVLLGWCLLLTKSRTAWIGTAAGLVLWGFGSQRLVVTRGRLAVIGGVIVCLAVGGWTLSRIGGLDRQVITEAPKSLQYRLQYWSATLPMIRDHILFGVGPGQFRSHYLYYKLPEASEEISDPHNLVLDVAANGGLIALVGLFAIGLLFIVNGNSPKGNVQPSEEPVSDFYVPRVLSGLVAAIWCCLLCTGYDDRLLVFLPAAVVMYWVLRGVVGSGNADERIWRVSAVCAGFALFVHLLGAGGIGMPAVSLLLLGLVALADGGRSPAPRFSWDNSQGAFATTMVFGVGLLGALFFTALQPVAVVATRLQQGDRLVQKGLSEAADAEYGLATSADTFSGEPWRKRAEVAFRRAEADRFRSNDSFVNAVRLMREAAARDPVNFQDDRRIGDWWLSRWQVTHELKDAQEAVAAFEQASARYPTNAMLMAELAFAFDAAEKGGDASMVAHKAIAQDQINRERGHVDRVLADSVRTRLERLSATPN